jgi:hypothetical protein
VTGKRPTIVWARSPRRTSAARKSEPDELKQRLVKLPAKHQRQFARPTIDPKVKAQIQDLIKRMVRPPDDE